MGQSAAPKLLIDGTDCAMMRAMRSAFLIFAILLAPLNRATAQDGVPFVDHFRRIDATRWRLSDGWSNGAWTANDWRALQVSSGANGASILLSARPDRQQPFSSGELQTHATYQRGYFEARLQAASGSGLVTGFFTFTRESDAPSTWDEIDVEILGRDTRSVQLSYYRSGAKRFVVLPLGFDAAAGVHTYAFDWQARYIRWYIDGVMRHQESGDGLPLPLRAQRLYINLWNSSTLTDWVGPIVGRGPWRTRVECVAQAESAPARPLCAR
ncbi:MAG: family 16 glycosylhydrolase [Vitreimonas sp.]